MPLPTIKSATALVVQPEPLTPATFAPFGTVITTPLSPILTSYPATIPQPIYSNHQPQPVLANQATALKTSPIAPLTNNYPSSTNPGTGLMSIFSSFPRQNIYTTTESSTGCSKLKLKLGILERHPYTTQTFCPFNYSQPNRASQSTSPSTNNDRTYMLVIVAPTTTDPSSTPSNPPDLSQLRAFITPLNDPHTPTMAVTYAPGTWHAPMIILGSRRVDFLVTQFANGVSDDDCQEVLIGSGPDENVLTRQERMQRETNGTTISGNVEVDVSFLMYGFDKQGRAGKAEDKQWGTDRALLKITSASERAKI